MINKVIEKIEEAADEILRVSHLIHEHPEIGFEEYEACNVLCDGLEGMGFKVKRGVGKFDTAFVAEMGDKTGPSLAILAEYDALPSIGHACGHNVIAAVAYGVAAAFAEVMRDLKGRLKIIGTPAEENGGGKIELLKLGVFDEVDFAMMVHPASENLVKRGGTALVEVHVAYKGKGAHSSNPENGINALKALIHTFTGLDSIQGELPLGININGIIKEGGQASNIIPDYASGDFLIRATSLKDLKVAKNRLEDLIRATEIMTGAKATCIFELPYAERYPNHIMGQAFKEAMEVMEEKVYEPEANQKLGSSDIGNVSLYLPIIHPYVKIGDNLKAHTLSFTEAAKTKEADAMIIKASKALSRVAYRLFTEADFRKKVLEEFEATVPNYKEFEF